MYFFPFTFHNKVVPIFKSDNAKISESSGSKDRELVMCSLPSSWHSTVHHSMQYFTSISYVRIQLPAYFWSVRTSMLSATLADGFFALLLVLT